ncbi:MAG: cob(I)yrinic acid a,c-diamide adenosyltransferase [Opitutales bacterium]|nr:cob(I)yrinic acid a,c-diamide adenosyltransferase [Opitutales bacterium]
MSIATKNGDDGTTRLMFNRAVPKDDPRVEAYGTVDELNAVLGLARASGPPALRARVEAVQRRLVALMGGLAVLPEDAARYRAKGYPCLHDEAVEEVEAWIGELEAADSSFRGWVMPGGTAAGAAFDHARAVCRRAERRVYTLHMQSPVEGVVLRFLNRLSDLLWLLARKMEETAE